MREECIYCKGTGIVGANNPAGTSPQLMVCGSHICDHCKGSGKFKHLKLCSSCLAVLTEDEIKYYGVTCEKCESGVIYEPDLQETTVTKNDKDMPDKNTMPSIDIYEKEHDFGEGDRDVEFVLLEDYQNHIAELEQKHQKEIEGMRERLISAFHTMSVNRCEMSYQNIISTINQIMQGNKL